MRWFLIPAILMLPASVAAQEWDGSLSVKSDYRDRGVSQSGKDPAIQGDVELWFENGLTFGAWASSLEKAPSGGDVEYNLYGSYSGDVGSLGYWVAGAQFVGFIDGEGANYGEVFGILGVDIGFATGSLNLTYTPDRNDLDAGDNLYTQARIDAQYPGGDFGVSLTTGFDYFSRLEDKWDWSAGVFYQWEKLTFTLDYVDTNKNNFAEGGFGSGATVVGGIKFSF